MEWNGPLGAPGLNKAGNADVNYTVGMPSSGLTCLHTYNVNFVQCNR
jgi:hypothetical protein